MARDRSGEEIETPTEEAASSKCKQCHQPTSPRHGAIVVNDGFLCFGCHMDQLRARASRQQDLCIEPGCAKTVAQHVAEMKAKMASEPWHKRFATVRL